MAQNHDQLEALLTEAEQLIAQFDAGESIDHLRPADDIIRNLMGNNAFNQGSRVEGSRELQVLGRLQEIRDPSAVRGASSRQNEPRGPRGRMRYNAARAAAGAGNEAWVLNTSYGGQRKSKKTRKVRKYRKARKGATRK